MKHLYECEFWNDEHRDEETPFEVIFDNNSKKQVKVSKKFFRNLEKNENIRMKKILNHMRSVEPLSSFCENSNGNENKNNNPYFDLMSQPNNISKFKYVNQGHFGTLQSLNSDAPGKLMDRKISA